MTTHLDALRMLDQRFLNLSAPALIRTTVAHEALDDCLAAQDVANGLLVQFSDLANLQMLLGRLPECIEEGRRIRHFSRLFLIILNAGSVGLNLTAADTVTSHGGIQPW